MDFRIADTFTDSLARLTGDEQKAVKTTAFDLQMNPASPGMSFRKLAGDEVLATAILVRLLHKCHVLDIKGRGYRLRELERSVKARL